MTRDQANTRSRVITIDSADDSRLADYAQLKARPSGRGESSDHFVVEGPLVIQRLLASRIPVRSILVSEGRDPALVRPPSAVDGSAMGAPGDIAPQDPPVYLVPREVIRGIAGFDFHRGFLASADRVPIAGIDAFRGDRLSLALMDISDMQNLGSILRSAAAFGIRQVLIDRRTVDPYSRRTVRVSMGASLRMDYRMIEDPVRDLGELAGRGTRVLAATLAADARPIEAWQWDDRPVVLMVGNEGYGLPVPLQQVATERVIIPMGGKSLGDDIVDSLNVSVATAILMYQLTGHAK